MKNCRNCKAEVEENYRFCPHCSMQLKCLKCGEDLGQSFTVCAFCGAKLQTHENATVLNEYSFIEEREGDKYKRSVNLKATNIAVEKLGGLIISNSQPVLAPAPQKNSSTNEGEDSFAQEVNLLLPPSSDNSKVEDSEESIKQNADPYVMVKDYIFPLDDKLEVKLVDFKGNSKASNQKRFILLFVGSFQYYFTNQVPSRKQVIERAKNLGVWNTSFSHVITDLEKTYLIESEDGLRLSPTGKQEVIKIIHEIVNPNGPAANNSSKQTRKSNRSKPKSGSEREQKVSQLIDALGDLRTFDARELQKTTNRQKLQFGLWAIKRTSNIERISLPVLIEFLLKAFPTIGSTKEALRKSVEENKFFGKTSSGEYFLTKEGEADIEQLLPERIKRK